jgi:hypothetical protein
MIASRVSCMARAAITWEAGNLSRDPAMSRAIPFVAILSALLLLGSPHTFAAPVSPEEARDHVGENATVWGIVASALSRPHAEIGYHQGITEVRIRGGLCRILIVSRQVPRRLPVIPGE